MANKTRPPTKSSSPPIDGDGNHIHNQILLDLPAEESEKLFPKLEFVRLKVHHLLHETGDTLKSAFFCNSGMVSILSVFPDGKSVEVGLVGKEAICRVAAGSWISHLVHQGHRSDRRFSFSSGQRYAG